MEQDDYFGPAGIPGMSPVRRRPGSVSPTKPSIIDIKEENDDESNAIVPDSRAILAKMKETMAGVKRRESLQPSTPLLERSRKISSMDMDVDVREDRETSEASSSSNHTNPFLDTVPVTAKPSFQGMRELFNTSKVPAGMNTPAMKSMRSLFRPEPQNNRTGLHSPMMERAGEFLQSEDVKDEVPKAEARNAGKKSRVLRATATDTPSLADDEASPVVGEHIPDNEEENEEETAQKKGRILRARPASNKPPSVCICFDLLLQCLTSLDFLGSITTDERTV
ncbi:hypothetical protein DL96DRAFT_464907 [Flagelloscypha sp. PMI_526]|nr:hypothetical protein DL96DRAFT_464907 [Flagelloscypha sp. PMI_526]